MSMLVRCLCVGLLVTVLPGCDESFTGPTVSLNSRVTLAPGDVARIADTSLRLQFLGVQGDSRCPADALCIQGGDALVSIFVLTEDRRDEYVLHTGSMAPVRHGDLTITLVELSPYPFSSRTIAPAEYRATLQVTR